MAAAHAHRYGHPNRTGRIIETRCRRGSGTPRARAVETCVLSSLTAGLYDARAYGKGGVHSTPPDALLRSAGTRPGPRRGGRATGEGAPEHGARKVRRLRSPTRPRTRGVMVSVPSRDLDFRAKQNGNSRAQCRKPCGGRDVHALLGFAQTRRVVLSSHCPLRATARSFSASVVAPSLRARLMNFADYRLQRTLGPARFHAHQCVGPIAAGAASFSQLKRALGQTPSLSSTGDLVGSRPPVILALIGLLRQLARGACRACQPHGVLGSLHRGLPLV